jgi:hypothetical protein
VAGLVSAPRAPRLGVVLQSILPDHTPSPRAAQTHPRQYFAGGCAIRRIYSQLKVNNTHSELGWRAQNYIIWGPLHCILLHWNNKHANCFWTNVLISVRKYCLFTQWMSGSMDWWPVEWMNGLANSRIHRRINWQMVDDWMQWRLLWQSVVKAKWISDI